MMYRKFLCVMLTLALLCPMTLCRAEEESGWRHILLLGGDARASDAYDRSDSMIILSVNETEKQAKMTSLMRDIYLTFPGYQSRQKLNAAIVRGGPELLMQTIAQYFGLEISEYVLVNMLGLIDVVDCIGGIDLDVESDLLSYVNNTIKDYAGTREDAIYLTAGGEQHLNGVQALSYSRVRHADSDFYRVERQQKVLLAMADQLQHASMAQLVQMIMTLTEMVETNLTMMEMLQIARAGLALDLDGIETLRLPADGTFKAGRIESGDYVIEPNFEANAAILHDFIYGDAQSAAEQ